MISGLVTYLLFLKCMYRYHNKQNQGLVNRFDSEKQKKKKILIKGYFANEIHTNIDI